MTFDTHYFHDVCIYALYGSMGVLAFVMIERLFYYSFLNWRSGYLSAAVEGKSKRLTPERVEQALKRRDVVTRNVSTFLSEMNKPGVSRARLEDLSSAAYVSVTGRIGARLWLLDTIVTAAPLLGLLGTILGIMDTFNALSAGGISDPAAVSRGIAAALLATAIGIGTALFGLLCYNVLHRYSEHISERVKHILLLAENLRTVGSSEASPASTSNTAPTTRPFDNAA